MFLLPRETMTEPHYRHLNCQVEQGILILTIIEVHLEGDEVAEELRQEMLDAVAASGIRQVVVDFRNTKYISSVAFRPLLSLRRRLIEINGLMMLCCLSEEIGDVLYTTRLVSNDGSFTAPFAMEKDVPAAIAKLRQLALATEA